MEPIQELLHIDFIQFIFTTLIIMSGITSIVMVVAKFAEFIGKPIKWFNRNNKDHDLLIQTVNSVAELQSKHHEDIENMKQAQKENSEQSIKQQSSKQNKTIFDQPECRSTFFIRYSKRTQCT